jgi:hypothetical protein
MPGNSIHIFIYIQVTGIKKLWIHLLLEHKISLFSTKISPHQTNYQYPHTINYDLQITVIVAFLRVC